MINVNQITSQLAKMPDPMLQQYAQMHKGDPYILSLALAESNRRKEMRAGAQMGAQQQPKVVDQEIQGMAAPMPEHVGIGQLPMNNPGYADGGIVAFGGGGDVPRYADTGLVDENLPLWAQSLRAQRLKNAAEQAKQLEAERVRNMALANAQGFVRPGMPNDPRLLGTTPSDETVGAVPSAPPVPPTGPGPGATPPAPTGGARGAGPGQTAAPTGGLTALPGMQTASQLYQAARESVPLVDPAAAEREALGLEGIRGAQERLKTRQEELEKEGDVFKPRAERLAQREGQLSKDEATNQSLAIMMAGFTTMATPGGLAAALGKGAMVGTEKFAAGLDKIRAAQDKLEEAKDNLDTLRLNRKDMNARDIRALQADIDKAKLDARKLGIEGIMAASDLKEKQAAKLVDVGAEQEKTRYQGAVELRGREIGARATLGAAAMSPDRIAFQAALAKHKGDAVAAYREMQEAKREPMTREKALAQWTTPGAAAMIQSQFPNVKTFEDYWAIASGGGGGGGDGIKFLGVRPSP